MATEREVADTSLEKGGRLTGWAPVGLVLMWGIWDVCVFRQIDSSYLGNAARLLARGVYFAPPVLAALWGAWGPGRAIVRWPVALGLLVMHAICCTTTADWHLDLVALTLAFMASFLLLLLGRRITGWSIHDGELMGISAKNGSYGVRYLLGLTTFVALLAGLVKGTDAVGWIQTEGIDPVSLAVFALMFLLFTMPVALLFIVTLMTGPHVVKRVLVVLLIGAVATVIIALLTQLLTQESLATEFQQTGSVLLGASAAVGVSAMLLRCAGYRIGRITGHNLKRGGDRLLEPK